MSKIGRNEPCPCGSGKKFKKCCGASFVEQFDADAVNQELYQAHGALISFTEQHYDSVMNKQLEQYEHEEALHDIYKIGLTPWIVMKLPLLENGKTIFQAFMDEKRDALSLPARQQLLLWLAQEPSVFEIVGLDRQDRQQGFAQIRNIAGKKETSLIPYDNPDNFPEGSLVNGFVVPFIGHDNFLFQMIRLFSGTKVEFQKLILAHNHYPALLHDVIENGIFHNQWLHPMHEEVADLFANYAVEKEYDNKDVAEGILLWNNYCNQMNPAIIKPESHAAAFAYYFEKDMKANSEVRQSEVADQFGTSPSTLSATYRRIANELND